MQVARHVDMVQTVSMNVRQWISSLPGAPSITAAASAAGIQKTTLMRQVERGEIPAENVIALARAHDVNVIDALVELGYLSPDEVELAGIPTALGHATNAQILEEIRRRTDPEAARLLRGGDGDVITPNFGGAASAPIAAHDGEKGVPDPFPPEDGEQP